MHTRERLEGSIAELKQKHQQQMQQLQTSLRLSKRTQALQKGEADRSLAIELDRAVSAAEAATAELALVRAQKEEVEDEHDRVVARNRVLEEEVTEAREKRDLINETLRTGGLEGAHTHAHTHTHVFLLTYRENEIDKQTDKQTDRQTGKQTHK